MGENGREARYRRESGGIVIGAVIAGYFMTPLFSRADPITLAMGGAALGLSLFSVYQWAVVGEKTNGNKLTAYIGMVLGFGLLAVAIWSASSTSLALDRRCLVVQEEMLTGRRAGGAERLSGQPNAAELFQAMGCRPQF